MKIAVWLVRILVGATFIVSGVSKLIDPIGFQIKISDYLAAWGLSGIIPSGLIMLCGALLSAFEFLTGFALATGSMRRTAPVGALLLMAAMLPLSAVIALTDPVDHCGCFGDFLIISNSATFAKNVALTAGAIFLVRANRRAPALIAPWIQWAAGAASLAYAIFIALVGYHEQPLIDFRPYPVGGPLVDDADPEALYVYSRPDGSEQTFADTELPADDSGWQFKEVKLITPPSERQFTLLDRHTGRDLTDSIVGATPAQMILLLPRPSLAGAAGSYIANELNAEMTRRYGPGSFFAVAPRDSAALARAVNAMMPDYPFYYADQKAILALARGPMALVYLADDTIRWKRTLSSVNLDRLSPEADLALTYATDGPARFRRLSLLYLAALLVLALIGLLPNLRKKSPAKNSDKKLLIDN